MSGNNNSSSNNNNNNSNNHSNNNCNNSSNNWKEKWLNYVSRQSEKTARDPNAKAKLMGMVVVLGIIFYKLQPAEAAFIACTPCVTWAAQFCTGLIAAGGACASVAAFPPLLCACLLAAGAGGCLAAAGTCVVICAAV